MQIFWITCGYACGVDFAYEIKKSFWEINSAFFDEINQIVSFYRNGLGRFGYNRFEHFFQRKVAEKDYV